MSNSANLNKMLAAVKRARRPFTAQKPEGASLFDRVKSRKETPAGPDAQLNMIDDFIRARKSLATLDEKLKAARQNAEALSAETLHSGPPGRAQAGRLKRLYQDINRLQQKRDTSHNAFKAHRSALKKTGVGLNDLDETRAGLQAQSGQLKAQKQEQLKRRADSLAAFGSGSLKLAKTGFNAGKKILTTGYEQSLRHHDAAPQPGPAAADKAAGAPSEGQTALNVLQRTYQDIKSRAAVSTSAEFNTPQAGAAGDSSADGGLQIVQSARQVFNGGDVFNERPGENGGERTPQPESRAEGGLRPLQSSSQSLDGADILRAQRQGSAGDNVPPPAGGQARSDLQIIQSSTQVLNAAAPRYAMGPEGSEAGAATAGELTGTTSTQESNLGTDLQAFQAVRESLSQDIFSQQESSLRSLVQTATSYLSQLQQWVQNNQGLAQTFGLIAAVVIGVAGAIGTLASVIAPVISGIGILISVAATVGSVFATVFEAIGIAVAAVGLPIWGVALLIGGIITFVLAKLGYLDGIWKTIVDKYNKVKEMLGFGESEAREQAPSAGAGAVGIAAALPALQQGNTQTGFNRYQAITPSAGNSFTDQSKTEVNIALQGDVSPGSDNSRQLQDLFAKIDSDKRNSALSHFSAMGGLPA